MPSSLIAHGNRPADGDASPADCGRPFNVVSSIWLGCSSPPKTRREICAIGSSSLARYLSRSKHRGHDEAVYRGRTRLQFRQ